MMIGSMAGATPAFGARQSVHVGGGFALERVERRPERIDIDVVEEPGDLLLLPLPRGLPYAAQRLVHAIPALSPERALLIRGSLGPRPWLHHLRNRRPGFVRRLLSYYGGGRLFLIVHPRGPGPPLPPPATPPPGGLVDPPGFPRPPHTRACV